MDQKNWRDIMGVSCNDVIENIKKFREELMHTPDNLDPENIRCETCPSYQEKTNTNGLCRFDIPKMKTDTYCSVWPEVRFNDWCGNHPGFKRSIAPAPVPPGPYSQKDEMERWLLIYWKIIGETIIDNGWSVKGLYEHIESENLPFRVEFEEMWKNGTGINSR